MANLKRRIAERQTELKRLKRDLSKGYIHGSVAVGTANHQIMELEILIKSIGEQLRMTIPSGTIL